MIYPLVPGKKEGKRGEPSTRFTLILRGAAQKGGKGKLDAFPDSVRAHFKKKKGKVYLSRQRGRDGVEGKTLTICPRSTTDGEKKKREKGRSAYLYCKGRGKKGKMVYKKKKNRISPSSLPAGEKRESVYNSKLTRPREGKREPSGK